MDLCRAGVDHRGFRRCRFQPQFQLAKRRGAHVTAQTSLSKADDVEAVGADEIIGRGEVVPKESFDVVLDLVGGPEWAKVIGGLRGHGRYAVSGAIAGPMVELDLRTLYLRDLSLFGCTAQADSVFVDLVRYIEAGRDQTHARPDL